MRYVLCSRDRAIGRATVLGESTFATADAATEAIAEGRVVAPPGSDVRLVDLDAATPVLIVTGPAPVTEIWPSDVAGSQDAPARPEGPTADEPAMRMASGEGQWPDDVSVGWSFVAEDETSVGPSLVGADRLEDDAVRSELWWAEVGVETEAAHEAAPGPDGAAGLDGHEADAAMTDADCTADEEDLAHGADVAETLVGTTFARVDFDAWSCGDCVFTATCARGGIDRPVTCGSFQWRAE